MVDLVVTRHQGLVEYLLERGIITRDVPVISHATPDQVRGKDVIGVLPPHLSCLTRSVTKIPLNLTPQMRGMELSVDDVRKIAGPARTYYVTEVTLTYFRQYDSPPDFSEFHRAGGQTFEELKEETGCFSDCEVDILTTVCWAWTGDRDLYYARDFRGIFFAWGPKR